MENFHKYLNISELEREWGFYVTTVGYSKTSKNFQYPASEQHPVDHGFSWNKGRVLHDYYIVFITQGAGVFESADLPETTVESGTCFILFPETWHRYKPNSEIGWEEYWVGFNGSYPKELMKKFFDPKMPLIKTGLNKDLLNAFTNLLGTVVNGQIAYPQLIAGTTMQIVALLNRVKLLKTIENDSEALWVSQVIFLLQHQLDDKVNMETLADNFPISYSKFRKAFKKQTGKSPNQYHIDLRLNKAKELLEESNMSIKEVGYNTGFDSPYYFSRLFKQKFGRTPKSMRVTT